MGSCAFDKLLSKNVPHILEKIYLSLDYESYKECFEVCRTWNEILTSKRYLKIGKSVFQDKISEDERKLLEAAESDNTTEVRKLLRNRMLYIDSRHGHFLNTPLHEAAIKGRIIVVKLLVNRGSDLNAQDKYGDTPLHNAAYYGHKAVVKLLLGEEGAEVNKTNKYGGRTPLHEAARYGYKDIVKLLLEGGAEVNKPNQYGKTPLHEAARHDYKNIVQILLDNGAMHNVTSRNGRTPLSILKERGHTDIVDMIMSHFTKQQ